MRVTCKCCGKRYDISNREILEMAAKLKAGKRATEVNSNVAPDNPNESIALRFVAEKRAK